MKHVLSETSQWALWAWLLLRTGTMEAEQEYPLPGWSVLEQTGEGWRGGRCVVWVPGFLDIIFDLPM